jgi:diguanylate cyclase (GGDEF)-like protein
VRLSDLSIRVFTPKGDLANRTGAQLGAVLVVSSVVLSMPVFLTAAIAPRTRVLTFVMLLIRPPLAIAALALPWERWNRRWLLIWPMMTMFGGAGAGSVGFIDGAPALAGVFLTAFFFIGMTQPRGTSIAMLPIALPCWVATNGGWSTDLLIVLPLAMGVWILVAETLSLLHQQMRSLADGLVQEATTDPLTGLGNRRDLLHELATLVPGDAVVLLDLDNFKFVNDRFGHAAGDKVLADLGDAIRDMLRGNDRAIRLGGEEMLLLLSEAGEIGAREVLARLAARWAIDQPGITFSAGICIVGDIVAIDAVAAADAALYRAKHDGRNCWRFAGNLTSLAHPITG